MTTRLATGIAQGGDGGQAALQAVAQAKSRLGDIAADLAIVFCSSRFDYLEVVQVVREQVGPAPLIGCSTAGEFTEDETTSEGVAVGLIASDQIRFFIARATGLREDPFGAVGRAFAELPKQVEDHPHLSAVLLHDGLAGKGEETVLSAAAAFGAEISFFGGSAADDLKFESTSVFFNDEVLQDGVVVCMLATKKPVFTGIRHGHTPLSRKLTVTRAIENTIYEVDGRTAWEAWKEHAAEDARRHGIQVEELNDSTTIGQFLIRYELGLMTGIGEYKVRVPLSLNDDGSMNFACTIAQGASFRIMKSQKADQLSSARIAAEQAMHKAGDHKIAGALVFDCCCRRIILGSDFGLAIEGIKQVIGELPLLGFATYGEICMDMSAFSGYHNTTTVVALIAE